MQQRRPAIRDRTPRRGAATAALLVAVCVVAVNMRPTITAVGPLLDQIADDTGIALATLGVLGALPLVAWAAISPLALRLSRRFGMSRMVLWSLVALLLGTVVRSLPGQAASLWIGTVLIGAALAIANVLMPAVIKRDFAGDVPLMMGVYTALLGGTGAVASGVAVPLSRLGDEASGWRLALLITGASLLPLALVAWAIATRGHHASHLLTRRTPAPARNIWTDRVAWLVAAYMGVQAATFYMLLTWLATISVDSGRSDIAAGFDVMIYQLMTIAGPFVVPLLLRGRLRRFVPALLPLLGILGVVGLAVAPEAITVWVLPMGLTSGASLSMSLTLMAERARDADASAALSGMAQSVGYVVAAVGPVAFGWLHTVADGWMLSYALLAGAMVAQAVIGLAAGRDRYVFEPERTGQ